MRTWFTSDQHFGHANIIRFCARPFPDVDAMDEALVERWNEVVENDDEVWHLGGFAYRCGPNRAACLFDRLHGRRKNLITGNHDRRHILSLPWTSVAPYAEIKVGTVPVVLCHYAMRVWNRCHHGAWHLHGHSHGRLMPEGRSCDVGVDVWNFRPVSFEEIVASRSGIAVRC